MASLPHRQLTSVEGSHPRGSRNFLHMIGEWNHNPYDIATTVRLYGGRYLLTITTVHDGDQTPTRRARRRRGHYTHGLDLETGATASTLSPLVREGVDVVLEQLEAWV